MSQPYIGEIRMFGGNFAPAGWAFCDGQMLSIAENDALFTLIGTTYGGDGQETFALPDLQGRIPVHQGNGLSLGEQGGAETVTLTASQMPAHAHPVMASADTAQSGQASGRVVGVSPAFDAYNAEEPFAPMNSPNAIAAAGGSQPHENMQPYLCISFIISLFGIFPSPS